MNFTNESLTSALFAKPERLSIKICRNSCNARLGQNGDNKALTSGNFRQFWTRRRRAGASRWRGWKCECVRVAGQGGERAGCSRKDVRLPVQLQRAMAAEAEAAREARAKVRGACVTGRGDGIESRGSAGDRGRGRAEGEPGAQGGGRRDHAVAGGAAAALPADAEHHLGREELHHHLPAAHRAGRRLAELGAARSPPLSHYAVPRAPARSA